MILGWYSVYPAPNGVARLFRSDGNSGFVQIWWPDEFIGFYRSKTSCPRTSLNDGQLLRPTIVTISSFRCVPISKRLPNPMPDLINSCLDIYDRIPIYFLWGVSSFIPSPVYNTSLLQKCFPICGGVIFQRNSMKLQYLEPIFYGGAFFENVFSPEGRQKNLQKCWKSQNVWILSLIQWF